MRVSRESLSPVAMLRRRCGTVAGDPAVSCEVVALILSIVLDSRVDQVEELPVFLRFLRGHKAVANLPKTDIHRTVDVKFPRWGKGSPVPTLSKVVEDVLWMSDQTVVVVSVASDAKTGRVVGTIWTDG